MNEEYLWVERYRPKTIADCILPEELKQTFQAFVDKKDVPGLLLSGQPGTGKTTVARAMLEQLGCDYIVINGSLNGNIDTLRNDIQRFASSVSFTGGRKYVILDEADYLTTATQAALRNFMEEYSKNCGFILTCNFSNRIMDALRSRCSTIHFKIDKKEMPKLAAQFMKRATQILNENNIEYDKAVVASVISKHYPDWRKVLNELQRYSATGRIDSGILVNLQETTLKELMGFLKDKDFTAARKWVADNFDTDSSVLFRSIYDNASTYVEKSSIPALVLVLARYQYQDAFVADKELNLMACITELMVDCVFL